MKRILHSLACWPHPGEAVLSASAAGELGAEAARAVLRHTESCTKCRRAVEEEQSALGRIASARPSISEEDLQELVEEGRRSIECMIEAAAPAIDDALSKRLTEQAQALFGPHAANCFLVTGGDSQGKAAQAVRQLYCAFLGRKTLPETHSR